MGQIAVKSKDIKVYPSAYRGKITITTESGSADYVYNPESRLFTEENNIRPFVILATKKNGSFVIKYDATAQKLIFSLHGYFFKIENFDITSVVDSSDNYCYARIQIAKKGPSQEDPARPNTDYEAFSLVQVDTTQQNATAANQNSLDSGGTSDASVFLGVEIISAASSPVTSDWDEDDKEEGIFYLMLLEKSLNTWSVPKKSFVIYELENIATLNNEILSDHITIEPRDSGSQPDGVRILGNDYLTVGSRLAGTEGKSSLSVGFENIASGDFSSSLGYRGQALGGHAIAEGHTTLAEGADSHAEGVMSIALANNSHAEGGSSAARTETVQMVKDSDANPAGTSGELLYTQRDSGQYYPSIGDKLLYTESDGSAYYFITNTSLISGSSSTGFSYRVAFSELKAGQPSYRLPKVAKNTSVSLKVTAGGGGTTSGIGSHAEGVNTATTGQSSHAEGQAT